MIEKIGRRKGRLIVVQGKADDGGEGRDHQGEVAAVAATWQGEGRIGLAEQVGRKRRPGQLLDGNTSGGGNMQPMVTIGREMAGSEQRKWKEKKGKGKGEGKGRGRGDWSEEATGWWHCWLLTAVQEASGWSARAVGWLIDMGE